MNKTSTNTGYYSGTIGTVSTGTTTGYHQSVLNTPLTGTSINTVTDIDYEGSLTINYSTNQIQIT